MADMADSTYKTVYSCARCGAPLDVRPETIIAICGYCGYPNLISGQMSPEDVYIVPTQPRERVLDAFWHIVQSDPDLSPMRGEIEVVEMKGYYFPAWYSDVTLSGLVSWYRRYTEKVGDSYVTKTRYYSERINITEKFYIPARRQVAGTGIFDIMANYLVSNVAGIKLTAENIDWEKIKLDFLGVEIDKKGAELVIRDEAVDRLRERYRARGDGIDFFSAQVEDIRNLRLVYLPIWEVVYSYRSSTYLMVFSGWSLKNVYRTEPITPAQRGFLLAGSALLALIAGPATALALKLFGGDLSAFIVPLAMAGLAYSLSTSAFKGARVER